MASSVIVPAFDLSEKWQKREVPLRATSSPVFTLFTSRVPLGTFYVVVGPVPFTICDDKETRLSHFNGRVHRAQFVSEGAVRVEVG